MKVSAVTGVQSVAVQHVFLGAGGGQHDDRDVLERAIGLDRREDLASVPSGEVEIEQHEIGARGVGVGGSRRRKASAASPSPTTSSLPGNASVNTSWIMTTSPGSSSTSSTRI